MSIALEPVLPQDRDLFLEMAVQYFRELNPAFTPQEDWKLHYFEGLQGKEGVRVRWLTQDGRRVGFVIYGVERHRFLPRLVGYIYELYIRPPNRGAGLGKECAAKVIEELKAAGVSRIDLEVMSDNERAARFWRALGFCKVAERYTLGGM